MQANLARARALCESIANPAYGDDIVSVLGTRVCYGF